MANPTIVDPALVASVVRQFNLRGEMSPFILTNAVIPTFDIGKLVSAAVPEEVTTLLGFNGVRVGTSRTDTAISTGEVASLAAGVEDGGVIVNPLAAAILLVGIASANSAPHVLQVAVSCNVPADIVVEHRNAANAANLATWTFLLGGPAAGPNNPFVFKLTHFLATGERIRLLVGAGNIVGTVTCNLTQAEQRTSLADV